MPYKISNYTKSRARFLGVIVRPSKVKGKKIDVFLNGIKVASVGALGYPDYPMWLDLERKGKVPKGYADERRRNYKARHRANRLKKGTAGWYADQLLW